ncbi:MAG: DUF6807 family protein, partial [Verrucomicrobiota bacterium]
GAYRKNYHDPSDDWGREGGVLRCGPGGENLEIVARGFRNPWDITFDDEFTWLGTDNDQTMGDKIFSPFFGAHFGWGHAWSYDWKGEGHLPTVPASGPLFEGSGAGVIFCGLARYPEKYRGVFLINDWMRREIYVYRPMWDGALLVPQQPAFDLLAAAGSGRTMQSSGGRKFDPVDIEIGPDEAIYVSSWGREYGAAVRDGEMVNEGRIYRFWPKTAPPKSWRNARRDRPLSDWTTAALLSELDAPLPAWRVNAQEELIRREAQTELKNVLLQPGRSKALETWSAWTLGRIRPTDPELHALFVRWAKAEETSLNLRVQALRILTLRKYFPESLRDLASHREPRIRLEMMLAVRQVGDASWKTTLLERADHEQDRIVSYALWGALGRLFPKPERMALLKDSRKGVRRAALLSLLEEDALPDDALRAAASDSDAVTADLAKRRLAGKAEVVIRGPALPARMDSARAARITRRSDEKEVDARRTPALMPQPKRAEVTEILGLMPQADARRGRELFLSENGAGCTACHQLEGIGNVFAPDLKDIGRRADAEFIIRSIVEPSAAITEGFVTHTVTTRDGDEYSGIVVEETGTAIKLAMASGETTLIPRNLIRKRETSRLSAMPANYAELLTAHQIADLVAFLRQSNANPDSTPAASEEFRVTQGAGELHVAFGKSPVFTYIFEHAQLTRPALVNVRTPSGILITREFPAPAGSDHEWMHPGIGLSFGWLDGHDYWRMRARVKHVRFTREPAVRDGVLSWAVENHYLAERSTELVCIEKAQFDLRRNESGFALHIDTEFFNPNRDFYFGDQEESGLCLRMHPRFSVRGGSGTILNNRGEKNEAGTWGRPFQWIDYSGQIENKRAGIRIEPNPENPRPCWSHSRDYGVLVANPFPRQPQERREPYVKTSVKKGESLRLRFNLLIYETPAANF